MALASQTARHSSSGRLYSSRRGKGSWRSRRNSRLRRRIGLAGLTVLAIIVGWWWFSGEPDSAGAASDTRTAANEPTGAVLPSSAATNGAAFNISNAPDRSPTTPPRNQPSSQQPTPQNTSPLASLTMGERPQRETPTESPREITTPTTEDAPRRDPVPSGAVSSLIEDADVALAANEPLVARLLLNRALHDSRASEAERRACRARLASINDELLFSPRVVEGDPLVDRYVIKSGDSLSKIASSQNLAIDWRLLQRVNRITDPRRIRVGQTIKLVRGPFEAVIDKSDFRLDLYAVVGSDDSADSRVFIRSFNVGLGEHGATPVGSWVVRQNSKLINPHWVNPRTGERFSADNPDNPIGERWIGLEGTDDTTRQIQGIGIHGTIEPQSIGTEASMGCVRLNADDVEIIYEALVEGVSRVEIVP